MNNLHDPRVLLVSITVVTILLVVPIWMSKPVCFMCPFPTRNIYYAYKHKWNQNGDHISIPLQYDVVVNIGRKSGLFPSNYQNLIFNWNFSLSNLSVGFLQVSLSIPTEVCFWMDFSPRGVNKIPSRHHIAISPVL